MAWYYTTAGNTTTAGGHTWDYFSTTTSTASTSMSSWLSNNWRTGTFTIYSTDKISHRERSREEEDRIREQENRVREQENRAREQELIRRKAREEAREKAKILLLECLDNENKKRYLDEKPLEVASGLFGDIRYHIPISHGRIKALKEGNIVSELCLLVKHSELPLEDVLLTKLLYTLYDEKNMIKTANHSNIKENLLARLN